MERFPGSSLGPEVELAEARTFVLEKNWPAAIDTYEAWVQKYGASELRPLAEYYRAWTFSQAGRETNALTLFTNFVARFPNHELAPLAQSWIASFYYNQKDWVTAENHYQSKILLNNTNYAFQALMNAGRAAIARQGYNDAAKYFQSLIDNNSCPAGIKAEAYFALGDTYTWQAADPGKPLDKFDEAIKAFNKIPSLFPNDSLVPRAWGRKGDCYYQMASGDGKQADLKQYENATNSYQQVLSSNADVAARCQAEFGMGLAFEGMSKLKAVPESLALLDSAFARYANIVYQKNLAETEMPDAFWLKKAGLAAARLAEERKQWQVAIKIYTRLAGQLPPLRELLEKQIAKARDQQRLETD
jgi:tetratricopeptide (TPR) repeat protein